MFKVFLYAVLLSPIPFGTNRPFFWNLYALVFALFGLIICIQMAFGRCSMLINLRSIKYPAYLIGVPIVWSLLQQSNIVPDSWMHPFWQLAREQLPGMLKPSVSLSPQETETALMKFGSYLLVFIISLQFNADIKNARLTFNNLAYVGLSYASYGLITFLGHYNSVLWFEKSAYKEAVTSTFINRNSFATYTGLILLSSLPLLLENMKYSFYQNKKDFYNKQDFLEDSIIRNLFSILLLSIVTTALFLSLSRGGFLSTVLAMLTFFTIFLFRLFKTKTKIVTILLIATIVITFTGVFVQSGGTLIDRLNSTLIDKEERQFIYHILVKVSYENSWLGIGDGSFESAFKLYRNESIIGNYDKAHNTYLENIFELGILQALALFISIFLVVLTCLRGAFIRRKNWIYPTIGFSASILVGVHSLVDFSLQIPAIAFTYALIMGAALAQSFRDSERSVNNQDKKVKPLFGVSA